MIICHKHKFIFLRTKKTASTSLEIYLSQFCGKEDVITPDDFEAETLKEKLGQNSRNYQLPFKEYNLSDWKILIRNFSRKKVRHKYYNHMSSEELKKIISPEIWHNYFIFCFERNPYEKAVSAFNHHIKTHNLNRLEYTFDNFLKNHSYYRNFHRYSIAGEIVVNVLQYDKINEEIDRILKNLGIKNSPKIPRAKSHNSKRKHYSAYYNDKLKKIVQKNCSQEIEQFGYKFQEISDENETI